jgi:ribosomal protein S8
MEKEGFIQGMQFLEANELRVELLITDHHKAWIRENLPHV